jgi:hypothetical protein
MEEPPAVTDSKGEPIPQVDLGSLVPPEQQKEFFRVKDGKPVQVNLAPGKEIELYELKLKLRSGNVVYPNALAASGKVAIQYERVLGNSSAGRIKLDPTLSKLATGKLELEIRPAPPAAK